MSFEYQADNKELDSLKVLTKLSLHGLKFMTLEHFMFKHLDKYYIDYEHPDPKLLDVLRPCKNTIYPKSHARSAGWIVRRCLEYGLAHAEDVDFHTGSDTREDARRLPEGDCRFLRRSADLIGAVHSMGLDGVGWNRN